MDILEQLEHKILTTVSALQDARKDNHDLRLHKETAEKALNEIRKKLANAEERLQHRDTAITVLQQQYEAVKKESTRLAQEKNEWEVKVSALMETIAQTEVQDEAQTAGVA